MRASDVTFAVLVAILWGLAFPAITFDLESFSPAQLVALRFLVAAAPVVFLPRPDLPVAHIVLIGLPLFAGQFLLLFIAYTQGMTPGVASVVMQTQAFFTVLLSVMFLADVATGRQAAGMAVSFAGLATVGMTTGSDLNVLGLALTLAAALSWAIGNVLMRGTLRRPSIGIVAWLSLVPPLPALAYSGLFESAPPFWSAIVQASWTSLAAALYLGVFASLAAYALWADLLRRYPAAMVAPFSLLAPAVGVVAFALLFGEQLDPLRCAGMALIVGGLAVVLLPNRMFQPHGQPPADRA